MARLTATNMANKKKVKEDTSQYITYGTLRVESTIKPKLEKLSIDTGREDLNTMVMKVNEIIDLMNN